MQSSTSASGENASILNYGRRYTHSRQSGKLRETAVVRIPDARVSRQGNSQLPWGAKKRTTGKDRKRSIQHLCALGRFFELGCRFQAKDSLIIRQIRIRSGTRKWARIGINWRSSRLFAPFLMSRNRILAFALAALMVAYASAQTSSPPPKHSKTHHATVHHARTHHPAPPANPEAQEHKRVMKEEAARSKSSSRASTEGKSSLQQERNASSAQKAESSRQLRARKRSANKPRKHSSTNHTTGENRLDMQRRLSAESRSRYEEGYRAGFAAGLAARRSEAQSAYPAPQARPALQSATRMPASGSAEPAPAAAVEPHISDATVRSTTPVSGDNPVSADGDNETAVPATPHIEGTHARPEKASLAAAPGSVHVAPISLKASMLLLHEPVPAPMRGTLASLQRQNERLDAEGLQRVEDESDLQNRIARKLLVPLPASGGVDVNPTLPEQRRYCRTWTAQFLSDLARMHEAVFHKPLRVDSAVRTVSYQRRLIAINANAAPAEGSVASPHETGAAIDIGKKGMTWREIGWMRRYLTTLQNAGLIDVEEEFYQACFHITVYDTYGHHGIMHEARSGSSDGTDRTSDTAAAVDGTQGQ